MNRPIVTVSFECTIYQAALLTALYDLLQSDEIDSDIENCAPQTIENFDTLLNELQTRAPSVVRVGIYAHGSMRYDDLTSLTRLIVEDQVTPEELADFKQANL